MGYREITEALDEKAAEYDGFMSAVHDRIVTRLREEGIEATVYGRMKHPYSIYRKMYTQNKSLDDDLRPVRLPRHRGHGGGLLQRAGHHPRPVQAHSGPVQGLYRHPQAQRATSPCTPRSSAGSGIPFEVQIRTKEMHQMAEYGIAAHWKYKQNMASGKLGDRGPLSSGCARLLENQQDADAEDFMRTR